MTVEPSLDTVQHLSPSSFSPHGSLREGRTIASQPQTAEAASSKHSVFEGAHDFQMGVFQYLHAPNAAHVSIHVHSFRQFLGDWRVWLLATLSFALLIPRLIGAHHHNIGELVVLPKHPDMSGKPVGYLANSRKLEVEESREWVSNSTGLVLCIHGPAGIGKSTLAGHLSEELRSVGRLAASVFLGAFSTDTSGPETIIKMVAHELGSIHPRAIPKIVEAMNRCHGTSLETHIEGYILEPLRSLGHPYPLIIILDAIDEWRDHPTFIKALTHINSESDVVKFIVTSRLDRLPGIDKILVRRLLLLPVSKKVMIEYFEKHLDTVPWVNGRKASSIDAIHLAELSEGLPVWASTVISLLSQQFSKSPPHEILAGILTSERHVGGSEGLAELYSRALKRLFPSLDAQTHFRAYFKMTLVLQEPLPLSDFSTLTGIPSHLIGKIQLALSALQTWSTPPGSERIVYPATTLFRLSFLEYVRATTTEGSFAISPFDSHSALGLACLKQITNLPPMSPSQNPSSILRESQRYAIVYWPLHVSRGTLRSSVEWSQTPHRSILQTISTNARQRWAKLSFKILWPNLAGSWEESRVHTILKDAEASMPSILESLALPRGQIESCADQWVFQVTCLEVAVRLDSGHSGAWAGLGSLYRLMGDATGSPEMYEEAVVAYRSVLALRPEPQSLANTAVALDYLYRNHGDISALKESILLLREALALRPAPLPVRHDLLISLGRALHSLFNHSGNLSAVNEGIVYLREALTLQPASSPRAHTLLGMAHLSLYESGNHGGIDTLIEGISHYREALALDPAPCPDRPTLLHNVGSSLLVLYDRGGRIDVLNEAISYLREALVPYPAPRPNQIAHLQSFAAALSKLYDHNHNLATLIECIVHLREALAVGGPSTRLNTLSSLGAALDKLYSHNSDVNALNECISHFREALALSPAPHPNRIPYYLSTLSLSLYELYRHNRKIADLNECILHIREALAFVPAPHPGRPGPLQSLGIALCQLYDHNGDIDALKEGISHLREALALRPSFYPYLEQDLASFANALWFRFTHNGEAKMGILDLEEMILVYRELLAFRPPGHQDRALTLERLDSVLRARPSSTGDELDREEIQVLQQYPNEYEFRTKRGEGGTGDDGRRGGSDIDEPDNMEGELRRIRNGEYSKGERG